MPFRISSRTRRILLGNHPTRKATATIIQFLLIFLWHIGMFLLMEVIPFVRLAVWASQLYFRAGLTQSYISDVASYPSNNDSTITIVRAFLLSMIVLILTEALLGWFGYRIMVRRPKPRWYRFIRSWWRTCMWATLFVPVVIFLSSLLPIPFPFCYILVSPVVIGLFFFWCPGWMALREIVLRGKRIGQLCPVCRYCLYGIPGVICPECGTPLIHAKQGGFAIDQDRLGRVPI